MNEKHQECQPFIRVREVTSSTPWGGWVKKSMPADLRRRFFMAFWPENRLRRQLEMLKAFGFNSIEVGLNPCMALWVGADPEELRNQVLFRCKVARELGMLVTAIVWGTAVADPSLKGSGALESQQCTELDWHKPNDRARLKAWYREQAELAPYVDLVITHWNDPGGPKCKDCTIDTVVEMHNFIIGIYREKNPKIGSALSVWFMRPGEIWPGYESPGKLAANQALDRDTDIALGLMNYGADGVNLDWAGELKAVDLDAIAAAGRRAGVWGWYTADIEIQPALHVRTDAMQNYFRSLPSQTRTALAWHSLDDNFSGLNMHNLYVAGKLMQDPSLDAGKLLDDFVRGFVGEANVPAVVAALRAVELARTRSMSYKARIEDAVAPPAEWQKDRKPLSATWLDETAEAVDAAITGLKTIRLDSGFKTAWPVVMEPADYLDELTPHLEAIRQMLEFLKGIREVERMQATGMSVDKLEVAINALPKVIYDPVHTAGLEADLYQQKLSALKKALLGK